MDLAQFISDHPFFRCSSVIDASYQSPKACFDRLLAQRRPIEDELQRHHDALVKLRVQVQTHEEAMQHLKAQLNGSSYISRFPPETLIEIFKIYAAFSAYDGSQDLYSYSTRTLHPFPFIHVCRSWRILALNCPMLWSIINLHRSAECISYFLKLSKQAPLTIYCPYLEEIWKKHLQDTRNIFLSLSSSATSSRMTCHALRN